MIVVSALASANDVRIRIVAAENVYGDVARQTGGHQALVVGFLEML
jgi:hypothetical protein